MRLKISMNVFHNNWQETVSYNIHKFFLKRLPLPEELSYFKDFIIRDFPGFQYEQDIRNGQARRQSFAYVAETVLTVIWLPGEKQRIISFRRAHKYEREAYHAWLEKDFTD